MAERPIIFSGEMVRAILDGRKTQTRRDPRAWGKIKAGDRLWVRETWGFPAINDAATPGAVYRADGERDDVAYWRPSIYMPKCFSRLRLVAIADARVERLQDISEQEAIAEGCRATIGRQWWQGYRDIGAPALLHQTAPGDEPPEWMIEPKSMGRATWEDCFAREAFSAVWNRINAKRRSFAWDDNPWVAVISFEVID